MEGMSLEAMLLLLSLQSDSVLTEEQTAYGINLQQMQARELLELIERARERLVELGAPQNDELKAERLRISADYRIFLPERNNEEIRMQPLVKSLFILFLKHPEGIVFKNLPDYEDELFGIYSRVSKGDDLETMHQTVRRLVDPLGNSVNTMRSRLSYTLSSYFSDDRLLSLYRIRGRAGGEKGISLCRDYVIWE